MLDIEIKTQRQEKKKEEDSIPSEEQKVEGNVKVQVLLTDDQLKDSIKDLKLKLSELEGELVSKEVQKNSSY